MKIIKTLGLALASFTILSSYANELPRCDYEVKFDEGHEIQTKHSELFNKSVSDETSIKFWRRRCTTMDSYLYELIATVTPKVAGKSEVRIHEITTKQAKNRENIGIITENNKLQTATSYVIGRNDIFTSRLPHIDYGGAFELEVNCSEYYGKACTKAIFNFSDFPDTTSPTSGKYQAFQAHGMTLN